MNRPEDRPSSPPGAPPAGASAGWYGWLAIGLLALGVRLLHAWQIHGTDLATILLGDAQRYDEWARRIASGDWLGGGVFYQAPLYPYFLGLLHATGVRDPATIRVAQAVVAAFSCVFLGRAGEHFFSRRIGQVAGVLLALDPAAIFFDGLLQKGVLDVFWFSLLLMLAGSAGRRPERRGIWIGAGAALGCLALTRENALVILPLLLGWAWQHGRWRRAAAVVAGVGVVLLPVAWRNFAVGGEFHLTTSQFGPNFYIGNNGRADGTYQPLRPGRGDARFEQADATALAERELGRILSPREVSDFWTSKSVTFIREQPGKWMRLLARKWFLAWNAVELGDTEEQGVYAEHSTVLRWLAKCLHFGVLCPLAVLGVTWTWRDRRRLWILHATALVYALSVTAFYVFARYRLPLVAVVILFAAAGVVHCFRRLRRKPGRAEATALAAALAVAVWVNWPAGITGAEGAVTYCNLGLRLVKLGEPARALPHLRESLRRAPGYDEAHYALGVALFGLGQQEEALEHLEAAVRLNPTHADGWFNLGAALGSRGRREEAAECYRKSLELDPAHAEAWNNLGNILSDQGNADAAIEDLRRAVAIKPDYGAAFLNLGAALLQAGKVGEAAEALEHGVALQPGVWQAHYNLGQFKALRGDPAGAVAALQRARELMPAESPMQAPLRALLEQETAKLGQKAR